MGLFNKIFGFRWSLYIVRDENQLIYAMHEHSVIELVQYVMIGYFSEGRKPVDPWSLYINFNHKHQKIKLGPEHFNGETINPNLVNSIMSIDPGWKVKPGDPVFIEVATKRTLKIYERTIGEPFDIQAEVDRMKRGTPKEPTFHSVMDEVFGKT